MYTARDSWDRHAHKLAVLKGSGGWRECCADDDDALAEQIDEQLCGRPTRSSRTFRSRTGPLPQPHPAGDRHLPRHPFTEVIGYGSRHQYWFTVRASVSTADNEGGQDMLLAMMDNDEDESVETAIRSTKTYAGAQLGDVEGPTEFGVFMDAGGKGDLLGCTWRVALIPS